MLASESRAGAKLFGARTGLQCRNESCGMERQQTAEAQTDSFAFIFALFKSVTLIEMSMSEMNNCDFVLKHFYDRRRGGYMEIAVLLMQLWCCLLHKEQKSISLKYQSEKLYVPVMGLRDKVLVVGRLQGWLL